MITGFSGVNLYTVAPQALCDFYRQVLGLEVVFEGFGGCDGQRLGRPGWSTTLCVWDREKWNGGGPHNLVLVTDGLDETFAQIKQRGGTLEPPYTAVWGGRELTMNDPEGNNILMMEA